MADEPVRTEVLTDDGWLEFQEYFVHRRQAPDVREIRLAGVEAARATPEVAAALGGRRRDRRVPVQPDRLGRADPRRCPGSGRRSSRPASRGVPVVAVSPIVGGRALKGPADRMLVSLGHEASALGVARLYADIADVFVLDTVDAPLADAVAALGLRPVVADTIMSDDPSRARLAATVLEAAGLR